MSTDFFDLILPGTGYRCVASRSNGKWRHAFHPENEGAARKAKSFATEQCDVYFACASYNDPSAGRKGPNAASVRSFWLDLDTSEFKIGSNAVYTDKAEALEALARFCCDLGLITVTVVSSGYGVHAYWSMSDDLATDQWSEAAHSLKRACDKWGLKVDHSRTTDIASLLRVPGTSNWKDPENPQLVKLMSLGSPISFADFRQKLDAYIDAPYPSSRLEVAYKDIGSNTQLIAAYPPSDAHLIADRCAVMGHIRDTAGNVSEPLWFAGLGVLVHTEQGDNICHEWSRGHPQYEFTETQAKIDRLKAIGPTLCERFETHSKGLCDGCPHKDCA